MFGVIKTSKTSLIYNMKFHIILIAFTLLLFSCGTTSSTSNSSNEAFYLPNRIQTAFSTQYPKASNVTWSAYDVSSIPILDWEFAGWPAIGANDYTVRFTLDTFTYHAWYNAGGDWIGSAYTIKAAKPLPEAINNTLKAQFGSYNFDGAVKLFWKDEEAYEIKIKNGDANKMKILMDASGNILKQKAG